MVDSISGADLKGVPATNAANDDRSEVFEFQSLPNTYQPAGNARGSAPKLPGRGSFADQRTAVSESNTLTSPPPAYAKPLGKAPTQYIPSGSFQPRMAWNDDPYRQDRQEFYNTQQQAGYGGAPAMGYAPQPNMMYSAQQIDYQAQNNAQAQMARSQQQLACCLPMMICVPTIIETLTTCCVVGAISGGI